MILNLPNQLGSNDQNTWTSFRLTQQYPYAHGPVRSGRLGLTTDSATLADHASDRFGSYKIAVLVPCYNEETAVAKVVKDFRTALPAAKIFVFDNNSTDKTAQVARAAGAEVLRETHRGKGFVVRRMFSDVEADVYVLVDGDATYDASSVGRMIGPLLEKRLDMVVANRVDCEGGAYRVGHRTGNKLLTAFMTSVFGSNLNDMLSGYRVFSRRFVKSFPALSSGFKIETELTIHALDLGLAVEEVDTPYYARPQGSASKLNTWRDGLRILLTIVNLYRAERPLSFFTCTGTALAASSIGLAIPVIATFVETGLVPRLPTAVLSTGLMVLAFVPSPLALCSTR